MPKQGETLVISLFPPFQSFFRPAYPIVPSSSFCNAASSLPSILPCCWISLLRVQTSRYDHPFVGITLHVVSRDVISTNLMVFHLSFLQGLPKKWQITTWLCLWMKQLSLRCAGEYRILFVHRLRVDLHCNLAPFG